MPVHDWGRVDAGIFHDFHLAWIAELRRTLNSGLLPSEFYAMAEQRASEFEPDVLVLERQDLPPSESAGGIAVADAPPKLSMQSTIDLEVLYSSKRRTLSIRHASDDRIVALVEIVSPGNKDRAHAVERFVDKAAAAISDGDHLLVIDMIRPRSSDRDGMGNAVLRELRAEPFKLAHGKPLSVASFRVADKVYCYAECLAIGEALPDTPLFFEPDHYVNLPLESTYSEAYAGVPKRWRDVIEAKA